MNISVEQSLLRATARQVSAEMDNYVTANSAMLTQIYQEVPGAFNFSLQDYLKESRWAYLNNFHFNLPGGYTRLTIGRLGIEEINHRKYLLGFNKQSPNTVDLSQFSELFLSQTPVDFFGVIDDVIKMKKISSKKILALSNRTAIKELHKLTLPVFVHLRALGYNRHELTY